MNSLLNTFQGIDRGTVTSPALVTAYKKQVSNLEKIEKYYQDNYVPVDMAHPLVRLCYRFIWEITQNDFDYYNKADETKEELCSPLGITTSFNAGEIHDGIFYGSKCKTSLVLEVRDENRKAVMSGLKWMEMRPLRVLARSGVTGAYLRPDLINEDEAGYAVIAVDLPMMAAMYKRWQIANQKKAVEERQRPEHFVGRYLFPSMVYSQMDATVLNALNLPTIPSRLLKDQTDVALGLINRTDTFIKECFALIKSVESAMTWEQLVKLVPSFVTETMRESLPTIDGRISQANEWASLAGTLPYVRFCAKYTPSNPEITSLTNIWLRLDRHYTNDRTIDKAPSRTFSNILEGAYSLFLIDFLD